MCSTANYVLPLRRTCEVLATPGKLCGSVSMTTNFPGARSHGTPQDTDMDLAWQELMAITELQEFGVQTEGPYETPPNYTMENMAPMGEYGITQSHSEPAPSACALNSGIAYEGSYPEVVQACRQGGNIELMYGQPGSQLNPRVAPNSSLTQPSLMGLKEQMDTSSNNERHRKPNTCLSQGQNMQWTAHGQSYTRTADDLESDSGLSLGSSPPLASPDNATSGALVYQSTDMGMVFSDKEMDSPSEQARRACFHYSMDYQSQLSSYQYSGAHSSYFPTQPNPLNPASLELQASNLYQLHVNSSKVSSRGNPSVKSQVNIATSTTLSRDERRAMALKIPFTMEKIINLPVDDFNELLTQYTLTDTQLALVRDIRRRGKNKVAAQNCRKRKLENIIHLEGELRQLQAQKEHLAQERLEFQRSLSFIRCHLSDLYTEVFSHLRDENGHPYSIDEYSLQQTPDGKVYLTPCTAIKGKDQC
ncbi:transcription factor NF-E2 45 kDa subunit [Lampris incognitus]|uniref:transcription factor NF-E2 45 kDa subunit n=1 Tax=Lampris incognitus TaxID=2546036 RepID=UPI0024B5AD8A|nr:transcription factor NF-E2 45 kDa subunit [Lampris incognitus]XP_056154362.1 transcription factor NF-E2 45 kDa subunit [Lampris incognitus]